MENTKEQKPKYTEAELKRLLALDKAKVEESLAKNKAAGRKIGGIIAIVIALAAIVTIFMLISVNTRK